MAANQFSVISPSYCAPNSINLQINTDKGSVYSNTELVFYVKYKSLVTLHRHRVLFDDKENPIVTIYKKNMTLHGRCQVFRGNSNELLFSVKRSSMIKSGTTVRLDVFLANNKDEKICDFRIIIRGRETNISCTVFVGETPTFVAKMDSNGNVTVNRNIDYAFIVALLTIFIKMNSYSKMAGNAATSVGSSVIAATSVAGSAIAMAPMITPLFGENFDGEGQNAEEEDNLDEGEEELDDGATL